MENKTLVIMAAGFGTRFGGLKQLYSISDKGYSILDYSIFDAIYTGFNKIIFIVRESILQDFKYKYCGTLPEHVEVEFVIQSVKTVPTKFKPITNRTKPWGTGHVLLILKNHINENFALINADDLYGRHAFKLVFDALFGSKSNDGYFVGYRLNKTLSENGAVSRGECFVDSGDNLKNITERHQIEQIENSKAVRLDDDSDKLIEISMSTVVSMNFWGFTPSIFKDLESQFSVFLEKNANREKVEFYIAMIVEYAIKTNSMNFKKLSTDTKWYGITYRPDIIQVKNHITNLIDNDEYPERLW